MDETNDLRYNAFISYRHLPLDKAVATRLQTLLEAYRPPKGADYRNTNRINRVFRDESELPTSGDLGNDIRKALEQSNYLVLVCSAETVKSKWCMEELRYFKQLHNGQNDHILTVIVDGEPGEVFPEELTYEQKPIAQPDGTTATSRVTLEPLCTDVRAETVKQSLKQLNTEFLRVAAPILGCSYDDLYQRHQRRRKKRIAAISMGASAVILSVFLVVSIFAYRTYLSEQSYKTTLAESYARKGGEQAAAGNAQEALLYYTKALELTPEDAKSAAAGTILLLQSGGWPYFDHQEFGQILGGIPVKKAENELSIWARNSAGTRLLSNTMDDKLNSNYCVCDQDRNVLQVLDNRVGEFQAASADGNCWVFKLEDRLTLYYPDTGNSTEITVPTELSPGCDPQDILLEMAFPVAMSAGEDRAVVAYGGYVRLYSTEYGKASELVCVDMAAAFPDVAAHNGLMITNNLWVSRNGDLAAVSSGSSVALYQTKDLSLISVFPQYHTPLTGVSISADSSRIALSYGNTFGNDMQMPGGYFTVYTDTGELLFSKDFDPREPITGIAFDPASVSRVISWGAGTVRFWDIDSSSEFCMPLSAVSVIDAAFTSEGLCVVEAENYQLRYYNILDPMFRIEQSEESFPPVETPETVSLSAPQVPIAEAVAGRNGLIVAFDYFNLYLMDEEGGILAKEKVPQPVTRMTLSADRSCAYLYYPSYQYLYRLRLDYDNKSIETCDEVELRGYSPLKIWPAGDQTVVYANDNHLLLFGHEQQQTEQVIALQTPGNLSSACIDKSGNYLAATLRVIESTADTVNYTTHGVLELWDLRTGMHIMDFGDGIHDIDRTAFSEDGSLVYECNGKLYRRQVLTVTPDQQTVQFLSALSCFGLDLNQNVIRKDPLSVQPGMGNWAQYISENTFSDKKISAETAAPDAEDETLETITDTLLADYQEASWEERAVAFETVLTRLEHNQLPYTIQSADAFFSNYITIMGQVNDEALLRRGIITYISLMEAAAVLQPNEPNFYVEHLMKALEQSTTFDIQVAQALETNAVATQENLEWDKKNGTHLYETSGAIWLMYAGLLRGEGADAFESINTYFAKYPDEELILQESLVLQALFSGDVKRATDATNTYIQAFLAMGTDEFMLSWGIEQQLVNYNVVLMRGGITPQAMDDFVNGIDADIGFLLSRLPPEGQEMGLEIDDLVLKVNGIRVISDYQMFRLVTEGADKEMVWTVLRDGVIVELKGPPLTPLEIGGEFAVQIHK